MSTLRERVEGLIAEFRERASEQDKEMGIDGDDFRLCADELAAALAAEGLEPTNWKGVRWRDSVQASGLTEEIARHFGHECNLDVGGCGEDANEDNCEFAWVESKLSDFLDAQAAAPSLHKEGAGGWQLRELVRDLREAKMEGPSQVTRPVYEALNHVADRIEAALAAPPAGRAEEKEPRLK